MPVRKIYKWGYDKKTKPAKSNPLEINNYVSSASDATSDNGKLTF